MSETVGEVVRVRTMTGIIERLMDVADRLDSDTIEPDRANSISNVYQKVFSGITLSIKYAKLRGEKVVIPMLESATAEAPPA